MTTSFSRRLCAAAFAWCGAVLAVPAGAADLHAADFLGTLAPSLESYIAKGMKTYDSPGLAIGIIADDKLIYSKGFGVRRKSNSAPIDARTVFQIGSTTKAFLAASIAIVATAAA